MFTYDGTGWIRDYWSNTTYSNFKASGSSAAAGLVPKPSTTAGTTKFLREDATWAVPSGVAASELVDVDGNKWKIHTSIVTDNSAANLLKWEGYNATALDLLISTSSSIRRFDPDWTNRTIFIYNSSNKTAYKVDFKNIQILKSYNMTSKMTSTYDVLAHLEDDYIWWFDCTSFKEGYEDAEDFTAGYWKGKLVKSNWSGTTIETYTERSYFASEYSSSAESSAFGYGPYKATCYFTKDYIFMRRTIGDAGWYYTDYGDPVYNCTIKRADSTILT